VPRAAVVHAFSEACELSKNAHCESGRPVCALA
jgi:hypothetical protein